MVISSAAQLQIQILGKSSWGNTNRQYSKTVVFCSSDNKVNLLDKYFQKLDEKKKESIENDVNVPIRTKAELDLLNLYLEKLSEDSNWEKCISSTSANVKSQSESSVFAARTYPTVKPSPPLETSEDILGLYITSSLASVNIAVFLFELASPVSNSALYSLPMMYGAKINELIEDGEWWRLVSPMFLHSGLPHVALGCWALHTFGPHVIRRYGSLTFLLVYILGGMFGNLSSYLHTPEATVGGTGPVFGVIGAWLVARRQDESDLFNKAVLTAGMALALSHFGPVDDWNHVGAIMVGVVYGLFNGPEVQDVIKTRGYLWKSVGVFSLFLVLYLVLVLKVQPEGGLDPDRFFDRI